MLKGFTTPLTPKGMSSIVPPPPWHYAGDVMAIEYEADPKTVTSFLPEGLGQNADERGICYAHFVEWQGISDTGEEHLDPSRSQYTEFFVLVPARFGETAINYCPFIFVSQDVSLVRGLAQGFPKQIGSIRMTRSYAVPSKASPAIAPGGEFGATLSWSDRRLAQGRIVLKEQTDKPAGLGTRPYAGIRQFPNLSKGQHDKPLVRELVRGAARDVAFGPVWRGDAQLDFIPTTAHELYELRPTTVRAGYRYAMALTVDDLVPLRSYR
jgi:hypothetical protein